MFTYNGPLLVNMALHRMCMQQVLGTDDFLLLTTYLVRTLLMRLEKAGSVLL
jgi:hypothetical protein